MNYRSVQSLRTSIVTTYHFCHIILMSNARYVKNSVGMASCVNHEKTAQTDLGLCCLVGPYLLSFQISVHVMRL